MLCVAYDWRVTQTGVRCSVHPCVLVWTGAGHGPADRHTDRLSQICSDALPAGLAVLQVSWTAVDILVQWLNLMIEGKFKLGL